MFDGPLSLLVALVGGGVTGAVLVRRLSYRGHQASKRRAKRENELLAERTERYAELWHLCAPICTPNLKDLHHASATLGKPDLEVLREFGLALAEWYGRHGGVLDGRTRHWTILLRELCGRYVSDHLSEQGALPRWGTTGEWERLYLVKTAVRVAITRMHGRGFVFTKEDNAFTIRDVSMAEELLEPFAAIDRVWGVDRTQAERRRVIEDVLGVDDPEMPLLEHLPALLPATMRETTASLQSPEASHPMEPRSGTHVLIRPHARWSREDLLRRVRELGYPEPLWWDEVHDPSSVDVLVYADHHLSAEQIDGYPNLACLSLAMTGTDGIDTAHAESRGVETANVAGYATESVADLNVALLLERSRSLREAHLDCVAGRWQRIGLGRELSAFTVGIVGLGNIGLATARRLVPFGCRLVGWARRPEAEFTELGGVQVAKIEELLARSDVVIVQLKLVDQTRGFLDATRLAAMRDGALLINTARAGLVDHAALVQHVESGRLRVALDTHPEEPVRAEQLPAVLEYELLTPHIGFETSEAHARLLDATFANVAAFVARRGAPRHPNAATSGAAPTL